MLSQSLEGILRACGRVSTRWRKQWRYGIPIDMYRHLHHPLDYTLRCIHRCNVAPTCDSTLQRYANFKIPQKLSFELSNLWEEGGGATRGVERAKTAAHFGVAAFHCGAAGSAGEYALQLGIDSVGSALVK